MKLPGFTATPTLQARTLPRGAIIPSDDWLPHTNTRCYGLAMWCQDCQYGVCGNWHPCGLCVGFWW